MATYTYTIDPMHSRVNFSVKHMMIATVRGAFTVLSGQLEVDPENPTTAKVTASIDANSFDSGVAQRDAHVKSADFLDVEKFPTLTFTSRSFTKSGDGYKVVGDLTLHGVTKEVTINCDQVSEEVEDPMKNKRFAVSGTTQINRNDYGITISMPFGSGGKLVGDDIKVELDLQFIRPL